MSVIKNRKNLIKSTKQQFIVDTTIELIKKIGIDSIRMEDIASASNYTKRTLYAYFKSKNEIFLWAFTDDLINRWNYQEEQIALENSGLNKLNIWARSFYEFCDKNRHTLQVQNYITYNSIQIDNVSKSIFDRFKEINDKLAEGLRNIFDLGIEDGSLRKDIEMNITISQFLYSYRAILDRAFSDRYSFANFDKSAYMNHFMNLFTLSLKNI